MSLSSYQKFLKKIRDNIKYELGELDRFVKSHPDYIDSFKVTDSMMVESGTILHSKVLRTSGRLLEQLDAIIEAKDKYKIPANPPRDEGSNTGDNPTTVLPGEPQDSSGRGDLLVKRGGVGRGRKKGSKTNKK